MGEIVEIRVSRALHFSLPNNERRAQTIDRTTAVNNSHSPATNEPIHRGGGERESPIFQAIKAAFLSQNKDDLINRHGKGGAGSLM